MNKSIFFLISCFFLTNCGGNSATKPTVLVDSEYYTNEGIQAYKNSEWHLAQDFFTQALTLYQGIDKQEGILLSYINLAEVSLATNDYAKSEQYLTQASAIANNELLQRYDSRINLLYSLIALQQKQLNKATHFLQQILPDFNDAHPVTTPNPIQLAAIASRTKLAFLNNKDTLLWTQRYKSSLKKTVHKNTDRQARLLRFQSNLLIKKGLDDEAESKMQQALSLYKTKLSRIGIAISLLELAQLYEKQQRWQKAKNYLNRSKTVYEVLNNNKKIKLIDKTLMQINNKINR